MRTKDGGTLTGEELWEHYTRERHTDLSAYGGWQRAYAAMLDRIVGIEGKRLLDVGCACGAMVKAFLERGADVYGLDVEDCFVRRAVSGVEGRILFWPPDEPAFAPETFDVVHSSQVLEHVIEERAAQHVQCCADVMRPGGILFATLVLKVDDTPEDPGDDLTHVTIRPREFWQARARAASLEDASGEFRKAVEREAMFREYGWHWLAWRKKEVKA